MAKKEIGRREFLRLLAGTAAAAGLSHFRFLNAGGGGLASANDCTEANPDYCYYQSGDQDSCLGPPAHPDACNSAEPYEPDECRPDVGDADEC
jgi:hypothetical protein